MADLQKYYWDSNMWIGLVNGEPKKIAAIEYHYELARKGQSEIYTSTIAYVEVFRLRIEENLTKPLPQDGLDTIQEAIEQDFVKLIPVDMEIGRNARKLRRQLTDFQGAADAVHLASALRWGVDALFTYDKAHLIAQNGFLTDHFGRPLRICEPDDPPTLPLFSALVT